ncbi:MAG: hypothetical protein ACOCUS_00150 [Polyangiales bacterium]
MAATCAFLVAMHGRHRHPPSFFPLLVLIVACAAACGGRKIVVSGTEVYESHWNATLEELEPRASFELDCPTGQLTFSLIRRAGRRPVEVGVEGCGARELYTRVGDTWFGSGQADQAAAHRRQLEQQAAEQQRQQQQQQQQEQQQQYYQQQQPY